MLLLFLLASRLAPTFSLTSFQQHLRHHQYRKATENVAASCALALGLCVATTTPVHALDASDYDSMYKSSMGDNTPFSFSLPKTPEIKKKTETSPPPQQTFDIPKMDMPKVEVPKVDLPKMDMPKMPSFSAPSAPSFGAPSTPSLSAPSFTAPEISLPSFLGYVRLALSRSRPPFSVSGANPRHLRPKQNCKTARKSTQKRARRPPNFDEQT